MKEHQKIQKNKRIFKSDFDIIKPNVKKSLFENMLLNSFQKNGNRKFIFGIKKGCYARSI